MKISVLIIAHNEERYISRCIDSILKQTKKVDEIILIAHNCSDKTIEITKNFNNINIINFNGTEGVVHARIEGLTHVSGDIILCIDGDSFAKNNWVEEMTRTLESNRDNVVVGSWVKFKGSFFGVISNVFNKIACKTSGVTALRWLWGTSFGFYKKDLDNVKDIFEKSILLSKNLSLTRNPDDFWLAMFMSKIGNIEVTNRTCVTQNQKETNSINAIKRNRENILNGNKMKKFFKTI